MDIFKAGERIYFSQTNGSWKLGPILTERVLHGDEFNSVEISEASGVSIATQTVGPSRSMEAVLKVRMQSVSIFHCQLSRKKTQIYLYQDSSVV